MPGRKRLRARLADIANDFLHAWESSTDFDSSAQLPQIGARVLASDVEDHERSPMELGMMEREAARVSRGIYTLIPTSDRTRGHRSFCAMCAPTHRL